jgi:hypothetical protein
MSQKDIDPNVQLFVREKTDEERKLSDKAYAEKRVEKILYWLVTGVATALLAFILQRIFSGGL